MWPLISTILIRHLLHVTPFLFVEKPNSVCSGVLERWLHKYLTIPRVNPADGRRKSHWLQQLLSRCAQRSHGDASSLLIGTLCETQTTSSRTDSPQTSEPTQSSLTCNPSFPSALLPMLALADPNRQGRGEGTARRLKLAMLAGIDSGRTCSVPSISVPAGVWSRSRKTSTPGSTSLAESRLKPPVCCRS